MSEALLLPGVTDHHVHLGLVDADALRGTPVVETHDLGWGPAEIADLRARLAPDVRVRYAGPFHTAVGGYPVGRSWAPDAAIREVDGTRAAGAAVTEAAAAGAFAVKIALNSDAPLLDDATLTALVAAAHGVGLPAFVHAEGAGQAARAIAAGADVLVHTPWSERLADELVKDAVERGMRWISTLSIHKGRAQGIALDNARRFVALGGTLRYGTDMGNGPTPVGVHDGEIELLGECGLAGAALIHAVCPGEIGDAGAAGAGILLRGEGHRPHTAAELTEWLHTARRVTPAEREETP